MSITHGRPSTYSDGCRCDKCREAWRVYSRTNRKRRIYALAAGRAATALRHHHPETWQGLIEQATREVVEQERNE